MRANCNKSVDFPIPGSPPIKLTDPKTIPPPRTRLSSSLGVTILGSSCALTSIMLTQIALLDTYANTKVYNSNLMNGLTGMGIGIVIIILGLYMIVGINKLQKVD